MDDEPAPWSLDDEVDLEEEEEDIFFQTETENDSESSDKSNGGAPNEESSCFKIHPPSNNTNARTSPSHQINIAIPPKDRVNDCAPRSPAGEAWPMHDGIGSMLSKLGMKIRDYRKEPVL